MQDELAARGAWACVPSIRIAMLLGAVVWSLGAIGQPAFAQDAAPDLSRTAPVNEPAPPIDAETPPATTPASPSATDAEPAAAPSTDTGSASEAPPSTFTAPTSSETGADGTGAMTPPPADEILAIDAGDETDLAEASADEAPQSSVMPHDLSVWGMYEAADIVVKAVMIGLVFACFITWTVWLAKTIELGIAKAKLRAAIQRISSAESLTHAVQAFSGVRGPGSRLVHEAAEEVTRSARLLDHAGDQGVKERVTSRLSRIEAGAQRRMTLGTGVLATIGSTAPFVGLFGTVWGIMNSFIGIAQSQTTNLAVVAPGIAEALLATGIGLIAAIPAVIIYNAFARSIAGYKLLLADAAAGVERLVSHELDLRKLWQASKPAGKPAAAAE
ncbi:enterochelin ABC transporter [Hyphomicrobium nitrativorans NL23]|uniref:Biopolymer transport protein ExbB n=1 Tax=Hyphomicrobium nitrativorans NL23 TaxID=1029756 RepID=V5SBC4_9HYPH|nr:tonB-system energizer ExbB [Hyphomicrobium nitrativorans]AHB47808.1 enterochelin ABC transporter [Hyphomicrobium nitrativorans NL23]